MLNPWVLLGLTLFWLFSVAGAYFKGHQAAQADARAQYATELEQTIADHNKQAQIDARQAADAAAKDAAARTRSAMLRNQANEANRAKPLPISCNLDTERFRVLDDAIKAANGSDTPAASGLRPAINKANSASKPER